MEFPFRTPLRAPASAFHAEPSTNSIVTSRIVCGNICTDAVGGASVLRKAQRARASDETRSTLALTRCCCRCLAYVYGDFFPRAGCGNPHVRFDEGRVNRSR